MLEGFGRSVESVEAVAAQNNQVPGVPARLQVGAHWRLQRVQATARW